MCVRNKAIRKKDQQTTWLVCPFSYLFFYSSLSSFICILFWARKKRERKKKNMALDNWVADKLSDILGFREKAMSSFVVALGMTSLSLSFSSFLTFRPFSHLIISFTLGYFEG